MRRGRERMRWRNEGYGGMGGMEGMEGMEGKEVMEGKE